MMGLACQSEPGPTDPPIGFCSHAIVDDGTDNGQLLELQQVVLFPGGGGAWFVETASYETPIEPGCVDADCFTTTRDIYEVRWEPIVEGYALRTPGPEPLSWRCAVQPGGVNVDCIVSRKDDTQDTRYFSSRFGGRTKDGQPWRMFQDQWKNRPCIRSDTEHEAFYEDYWASW